MAMLYVVATPIGNLEDITMRAINVLKNVDFILAEDTRVTRRLLERYEIAKDVISYHQHSKLTKIDRIIGMLGEGKDVALVSDAGTPGINDPGGFLIQKVLEALPDTKVVPLPGPNAAIAALSISGFPADEFIYLGFPPHKKGRQTFFKRITDLPQTLVFYESKHRIFKTLEALRDVSQIGERPMMVARELTKQFETVYRGTASAILEALKADKALGEFVVVVAPELRKSHVEE
jgi:16S rRNA (cytidine1402-2'-O)-methyltransferase